jgi:hypothetical protein
MTVEDAIRNRRRLIEELEKEIDWLRSLGDPRQVALMPTPMGLLPVRERFLT